MGLQHIEFISILKRSPQQWEAFEKCVKECDLDITKALSLDFATRWDSTYLMIRNAIYYKNAFNRLAFKDRDIYEYVTPTRAEWENAASICKCLKRFYDVTLLLSGTSYPTANLFFRQFCEMKIAIRKWCQSNDVIVSNFAEAMKDKFDKYWDVINIALAVAAFLDPRYKNKVVELYLFNIYGHEKAELEKMKLKNVINKLFASYSSSMPSSTNKISTLKEHDLVEKSSNCLLNDEDEYEINIDVLYQSTDHESKKSELDIYMSEGLFKLDGDEKFNILLWWKGRATKFSILSRLARDVLCIQMSTVVSELAFSTGRRVINPFHSRLDPEIVEALVCTKDWMIASQKDVMKSKVEGLWDQLNDSRINEN